MSVFYSHCTNMDRDIVIWIQRILFLIAIITQVVDLASKNSTIRLNQAWYHARSQEPGKKDVKILRQGENVDAANPQFVRPTDPPSQDCVCPRIYDPVCASNNESYFNICIMECKTNYLGLNLTIVHQGNCIPF